MDVYTRKRTLKQYYQAPQKASTSPSEKCQNSQRKVISKMRRFLSWKVIRLVRRGKKEPVKSIIEKLGFSYAREWAAGYNLLSIALETKNIFMSKMLIDMGCRVNCKSQRGLKTPLHSAVRYGFVDIVSALLSKNANVHARDRSNATPLHYAVIRCNYEIAEMLLKSGADVNARTIRMNTPLHLAVKSWGRTKIAQLLIENGADVDARDATGRTILYVAAKHGLLKVIRRVLSHKPNLEDEKNQRSLISAVHSLSYNRELVNALLDYGFKFTAKNAKSASLLHAAARRGNVRVIESLLDLGANVNSVNKKKGDVTLLHTSVFYRYYELTEMLLTRGAAENAKDNQGDTPIRYALEQQHAMMSILLLSRMKNVKISSELFLHAAKNSTHENVKAILEFGSNLDPEARDEVGRTALHLNILNTAWFRAFRFRMNLTQIRLNSGRTVPITVNAPENVIEMLLDRGVPLEARDHFGRTAVHIAAKLRNHEAIRILVDHGADLSVKCVDGLTPLDYTRVETPEYDKDDDHNVYPHDEKPCESSVFWVHDCSRVGSQGITARMIVLPVELRAILSLPEEERTLDSESVRDMKFMRWHAQSVGYMKSQTIGESTLTPYDFLTKSINRLAYCVRNPDIVEHFESDLRSTKPFYYSFVTSRFRLASKRELLLRKGLESLKLISGFALPDICSVKVLDCLCNNDLKNLAKACCLYDSGDYSKLIFDDKPEFVAHSLEFLDFWSS